MTNITKETNMAKSWKELTLDEAVERAKGISRQALHIAIKTYTANGRTDIVEQLRLVRKTLKRDKRISKVGKDVVEATEARRKARAALVAEFAESDTRPVPGFEGKWEVTQDGRVWSHLHSKWLKASKKQYMYVGGGSSMLTLHRAVALAWLPNPENRRNVRHKDKDVTNNHVSNLEWWGKSRPIEQKLDK